MQSFTSEELLQFIYQETSNQQTSTINLVLEKDWNLKEEYNAIIATLQQLDSLALISPRKRTIDSLINHAKKVADECTTEV